MEEKNKEFTLAQEHAAPPPECAALPPEVLPPDTVLPGEVQQLIRTMTSDFLTEFYNFLRERGVDVSTSKCVFAGGGSLLLRGMIERGNKVAFPIFVEDIHANARGYELLYQSEVAANGQQ